MFGGGNGGFGGGQQTSFGGSAQASPMNAGGTTFGGRGMFGGNTAFGQSSATAFGGRGAGGRQGFTDSTRGGRASTRGGRVSSGRGRGFVDHSLQSVFGETTPTFSGGRGGARTPCTPGRGRGSASGGDFGAPYSGRGRGSTMSGGDFGAPYTGGRGRGSDFGTPYTGGRGRGSSGDFGTPTSGGRGRGRGYGAAASGGTSLSSLIGENPFAPPLSSSSGISGGYDQNESAGRGGGRSGGRNAGGRTPTTAFGNAATVQPNVRRRSDAGGRGGRSSGTAFGVPGVDGFVPPLPETPPPEVTQFGGRGGRGGGGTAAFGVSTTFGQSASAFGDSTQPESTGFGVGFAEPAENPFASSKSTFNQSSTTFGLGDNAPATVSARPKRQSASFPQQDSVAPSPFAGSLEARMSGGRGRGRGKQDFAQRVQEDEAPQFVSRQAKMKLQAMDGPLFESTPEVVTSGMTLKPKKKMNRATPAASPSASPTPGSPVSGTTSFIGDERNKAELSSATNLDGTCIDMCSPKERELHIRVDELSLFEKNFPGRPGMERELIVKRFQRSSADHKLDIPSELRPLGILRHTQLYLEQQIMDREQLGADPRFNPPRTPELIELYNFCWDRCRMIRKDFVLQNYRGAGGRVHPIAIDVHERIARYHILSEHELCEVQSFVAQQNMEQLGQTLKSLNELYDESRKIGDPAYLSPFEAEFRGYFILCTIDNGRGSDVLKFVKGLAAQVRESPLVKFAMQVFVARHTQDYFKFFKLLRDATYLQACLMFRWIPSVRSQALERMNRAYRNQPYPIDDLVEALCFDDIDHAEAVCSHHGLDVASSEEDKNTVVVNFGGEFESDIQLRQNKNPLPVRASIVYVSQKQGDYLRRDVCRGITEYAPDEYPMLSKLVEDTEAAERAAMYPDRAPDEDDYSSFAVYSSDPFDGYLQDNGDVSFERDAPSKLTSTATTSQHPRTLSTASDAEIQQHELDEISRKHADIERSKAQMMQRIQQLEREKQEKKLKAQQAEMAAKAQEQQSAEDEARLKAAAAKAKADAARKQQEEEQSRLRAQQELEVRLRQEAQAKKAAAEQARLASERRAAEIERLAQEEQRQKELQRQEEERKRLAAIEAERRREAERLAEEVRAKREAERRAEIARETARRKQLQRIQKQRLAILRLKFHQWKQFASMAREIPRGVKMEVSSLVDHHLDSPRDVMGWLFGGDRASGDVFGVRRRQWSAGASGVVKEFPQSFWRPLDIPSVTGEALKSSRHAAASWKVVVADLLDSGLSSFGSWCAVKFGVASAFLDDEERVSTVHVVHAPDQFGVAVCCRYLDANFSRTLSPAGQEKKLAGTSALIVPVDLSHVLSHSMLRRWEDRLSNMLERLHPSSRLGVMIVGFCASTTPRKGDALATLEASVQSIRAKFDQNVVFLDGDIVLEDDIFDGRVDVKLSQALYKLSSSSAKTEDLHVVEFSDLVDCAVNGALREDSTGASHLIALQDRLQSELWKIRDLLLSPAVIDIDAPIPELQGTLVTPAYGWNSRDAQRKRDAVLKLLTDHRIPNADAPLPSGAICEFFYAHITKLIDDLFAGLSCSSAVVSSVELKRVLHSILSSLHVEIMQHHDGIVVQDASRLLPWRQIFGEIYGAFAENLGDSLLYVPSAVLQGMQTSSERTEHAVDGKRRSRNRSPLSPNTQTAAVEFARVELKRALSNLVVPPEQVQGIKRLRQEIAKDRAESRQFQQFLQRELKKGV